MSFEIQVYCRKMPEGTLSIEGNLCLGKYEWHVNGRCAAAGMETIPEVVREIGETARECHWRSDDILIDAPAPRGEQSLRALNGYETQEFVKQAPLLSYAENFLPD